MEGVSIQWCNSCRAWSKSRRTSREAPSSAASSHLARALPFHHRHAAHECDTCGDQIVTTSATRFDADSYWRNSAAMVRTAAALAMTSAVQLDIALHDSHPELADFSALWAGNGI